MKLSQFKTPKSDEGSWMQVCDVATLRPIEGVRIRLAGSDSKIYNEISHKNSNRRLNNRKGIHKMRFDSLELEEDRKALMAHCTLAWEGIEDDDGMPVECNYENAYMVYRECPAIYDQVVEFVEDRENFLA